MLGEGIELCSIPNGEEEFSWLPDTVKKVFYHKEDKKTREKVQFLDDP